MLHPTFPRSPTQTRCLEVLGDGMVQGCPALWHLWATLEEKELSWATHSIHCDTWSQKISHVLSKFMILCWATFTAVLGCMWPTGHGLDTRGSGRPLREASEGAGADPGVG